DKILDLMVAADTQEKAQREAERELKEDIAEVEHEKAAARATTAEDEKQLTEWNARRSALRGEIDSDFLTSYDRVLKLRGFAIAEARDHKCMACHVMLRPQTWNDLRSKDDV